MPRIYRIELDSAEAVVVRVALRREMDRRAETRPKPAWKDVTACAQSVIAKLSDPANVTTVPAQDWAPGMGLPHGPLPSGLCGNREDHEPHVHDSASLGRFYCHADQAKRLPFAMGKKLQ